MVRLLHYLNVNSIYYHDIFFLVLIDITINIPRAFIKEKKLIVTNHSMK